MVLTGKGFGQLAKATTVLIGLLVVCHNVSLGQHRPRIQVPLQQRILQQIDQSDSAISVSSASDTVVPYLVNKEATLSQVINHITSYYQHGLDTIEIAAKLPGVETELRRMQVLLQSKGKQLNLRSLNSFLVLVQEKIDNLKDWQNTLMGYSAEMDAIEENVEHIVEDSTVKTLPADTSLFKLAVQQLRDIDAKYKQVDTLERLEWTHVGLLQNRVESAYILATDMMEGINYRMREVKRAIWEREEKELWGVTTSEYNTNLSQVFTESLTRSINVVRIYMASTWDTRSINLITLVLLITWCLVNLKKIRNKKDVATSLAPVHFLTRSTIIGCIVLVMTFGAFLESNIPMSYLHFTGILQLAGISFLLYPFLTTAARRFGAILIILWVGYMLDDLLGETAFGERWLLVAGGILSVVFCVRLLLFKGNLFTGITVPPVLKPLIWFYLIMSSLSLVFNLIGRTTLSKLFGLCGIHGLVYAATLWVSSRIVLEVIYLQSEAYKESRFSAFWDFSDLQKRFQYFLRLLSGIFWLILFTRNLSVFEPIYDLTTDFISKPRTLGSISFSFGSIFIFLFILWISSILSQFINFLFGQNSSDKSGKRRNIGTIALLGRIGILAIGFMIAVGASGIPLEKISFIIGALGVGIGFGLQSLVNNLVSGIILAFERPIQVGDQIEVAGKSGIVKEIGIRASKIANFEGADIIIPNGDLLSQTLTNWTLSNRNRRVELRVRVIREADVTKVSDLIRGVLQNRSDIMPAPGPSVLISGFGGNWVEFQLLFWSEDLGNTGGMTDAVIKELNAAFAREKIDLANPGQDIYIRTEAAAPNEPVS
jgi:potassium-dependent mechanosensitive channel